MNHIRLIIKREFLAKVRSRGFMVMTFVSPLLMVVIFTLINYLSGINSEGIRHIAVRSDSNFIKFSDLNDFDLFEFVDVNSIPIDSVSNRLYRGEYYGFLDIPNEDNIDKLSKSITYISAEDPNLGFVSEIEKQINYKLVEDKMVQKGISKDEISELTVTTNLNFENLSGQETSTILGGLKTGFGMVAGYMLMMFIVVYGNSVLRSVLEEKTNRIIEVIVSSVKPFQLMMGKIFGSASAALLQFSIWGIIILTFMYVGNVIFGLDTTSAINMNQNNIESGIEQSDMSSTGDLNYIISMIRHVPIAKMIILFIVYFLCGFLLYSSLYASIGAAVDSESDTQQFTLPVVLPLILGLYVGIGSVLSDPYGPVSVAFSWIPLTSPIVMLMRVPFGVSWFEIAGSLALLIVSFLFAVWVAGKIYRVGIFMHGKKPTYKDLVKWLRY